MKQWYVTDPSEHKFQVKAANSPIAFSNMIGYILSLLPGFCKRKNQTNNSKDVEDQKQPTQATHKPTTIETIYTVYSGKRLEISNHIDTASEDNVSDLADFCTNENVHHDISNPAIFPTKIYFQIAHAMKLLM